MQRPSFYGGRAIVVSGAAKIDVGRRFHRLERGDFFGEMVVLAGKRREATVKAVDLEALRIPADDLPAFLLDHPQVAVRRAWWSACAKCRTASTPGLAVSGSNSWD